MTTGRLRGLRRKIVGLIGLGGIVLAILGGGITYMVEMGRLDSLVEQLARDQALHLIHALRAGQGATGAPTLATGGFLYLRVDAGDESPAREIRQGDMPTSAWQRLDTLLATADVEHSHLNFTDGGRTYMLLSFPLADTVGRFTGLYRVEEPLAHELFRRVVWSVAGVFLIVVTSTLILIPLILGLERQVLRHARDAVEANLDALVTLGSAIAKRDSDTDAHNYRVTLYAIRLAESTGLEAERIRHLIRGAFLHDVGKIAIPDHILLKPGSLSPDEFEVMKSHVRHGTDIVAQSRWLAPAVEVISGHHEKFDGNGYPQGLTGEDIPLLARIFAIADVFDALTSKRPYKLALPLDLALNLLAEEREQHFDPELLDRFLDRADELYAHYGSGTDRDIRRELAVELKRYFG
jgi:HD-GYP domain-containing protein (c-di-GMP phosphodiesterase class II)